MRAVLFDDSSAGVTALPGGLAWAISLLVAGATLWLVVQLVQQQRHLTVRLEAVESLMTSGAARPASTDGAMAARPLGRASSANGIASGKRADGATRAVPFRLPGLAGETYTLDALCAAGRMVLLLFMSPGCRPCTELLPDAARWQQELAERFTLVVISSGPADANRDKFEPYGIAPVLLQPDFEVGASFGAPGTPSAVFIGTDGVVASEVRAGADSIRSLVAAVAGVPAEAAGSPSYRPG